MPPTGMPAIACMPGMDGMPGIPGIPSNPGMPAMGGIPGIPAMPGIPGIPVKPPTIPTGPCQVCPGCIGIEGAPTMPLRPWPLPWCCMAAARGGPDDGPTAGSAPDPAVLRVGALPTLSTTAGSRVSDALPDGAAMLDVPGGSVAKRCTIPCLVPDRARRRYGLLNVPGNTPLAGSSPSPVPAASTDRSIAASRCRACCSAASSASLH